MLITQMEICEAQRAWAEGVVAIGDAYSHGGDYVSYAAQLVDTLYAYDLGVVLFKPTRACHAQFRLTRDGAISYFVAGNEAYPEDHGFALDLWTTVQFENVELVMADDHALAMGNYFFTNHANIITKVEYTLGYVHDMDGHLRINLHHSSMPFASH